jgi:biotin carboxylase
MKRIVCIASEFKGYEFLETAHSAGWEVTLVTRNSIRDSAWPWKSLSAIHTVDDAAQPVDYVRAVTNIAGSHEIYRVVGLDEFDVITAALAREHLQLSGMTSSYLRRFRDKLTMRNIASNAGIPCPLYIGAFNQEEISRYLETAEGPWIVKPRHEVSAFGIRKCLTQDEVWSVLTDLDNRNTWRDHPSQFLIEQFIEGNVFHVDSVVENRKVKACGVSQYGTTPFKVTHEGGVFTSSIVPYKSDIRKQLEVMNRALLMAFEYERGVSHAEFLQSAKTGEFYLLEVAARVGGAYIANVLEHACGFNLWSEWARLETATDEAPYSLPKLRKEFAGIALALANVDAPDTSHYTDQEIVYRVNKPKHVGLIFRSPKQARVDTLIAEYSTRITNDFLAVAPAKERYDD